MDKEITLEEDRAYNHQEIKKLLEDLRKFFQEDLKIVLSEWGSEKENHSIEKANEDFITIFFIEKDKQPIYEECRGKDDIEKVLNLFDEKLNELYDDFDDLLNRNPTLDKESKGSLESYIKAIDKCITVYENQKGKKISKFNEMDTVSELKEELRHFLGDIINRYIITILIDPLYIRIKNNAESIYSLMVKKINKFLAEMGVYTKEITIEEAFHPEYMTPTEDSADNTTDDFNKFDTIDEIRRYPYYFSDDIKIIDGSAKIWRRKD